MFSKYIEKMIRLCAQIADRPIVKNGKSIQIYDLQMWQCGMTLFTGHSQ